MSNKSYYVANDWLDLVNLNYLSVYKEVKHSLSNGLWDRTQLISRGFNNNIIHGEISTNQYATKQVCIPRIHLSPPENEWYPFEFIQMWFSICLYLQWQ